MEIYPDPTDIDISTMTVITKISALNKNKLVEESINEDEGNNNKGNGEGNGEGNSEGNSVKDSSKNTEESFSENFEIDLDKFTRFVNVYPPNDPQLHKKEGGIIEIDYPSNLNRGYTNKKKKKSPFYNQATIIYEYWGFRSVNIKIFNNGKLQMTGIQSSEEAKLITQYLIQKLKETNIYLYTSLNQIKKLKNQEYSMYYNPKTTKYCYYRKNYISKMGIDSILDGNEISELLGISQSNTESSNMEVPNMESSNTNVPNTGASNTNVPNTGASNMEVPNTEAQQIEDKEKFINKINIWLSDNEIMVINNKIAHKLAQLINLSNAKNSKIIENMHNNDNHLNNQTQINSIKSINKKISEIQSVLKRMEKISKIDKEILDNIIKNNKENLENIDCVKDVENDIIDLGNDIDCNYLLKLSYLKIELINSDFNTYFVINNTKLHQILRNKYKIFSTYEPNDYPGVKSKYCWNKNNKDKATEGICVCDTPCFSLGKKSVCTQITISVFQSGSIIITGAKSIHQVEDTYRFMNRVLKDNYEIIKGKTTEEDVKRFATGSNNLRKITKKKRLFYEKKCNIVNYDKIINKSLKNQQKINKKSANNK